MKKHMSRRVAAVSLVSALSFTLVACPSSDDQDSVENESESPENERENESPENEREESPENERENESPGNEREESPENETGDGAEDP